MQDKRQTGLNHPDVFTSKAKLASASGAHAIHSEAASLEEQRDGGGLADSTGVVLDGLLTHCDEGSASAPAGSQAAPAGQAISEAAGQWGPQQPKSGVGSEETETATGGESQFHGGQPASEGMLHLFAGKPRVGSFAEAGAHLGSAVVQVDLLHGGAAHDVASEDFREEIIRAVREGTFTIVWIGTPCSSFSLWWLDASMRQLRSRDRPEGLPGLPARERAYLRKHNAMAEFSARVALAAFEAGATFIIENPPDRGMIGSRLYRWRARRHAPLWLMHCMRELARETQPLWLTFPQCAFGGLFQKWTTLMAAGPRANQLMALGQLECTHDKHERVAMGRDAAGASNAAAAGAYPIGMTAFVMWALARPELRSGQWPVAAPTDVRPYVGDALSALEANRREQQRRNEAAAARVCGDVCIGCDQPQPEAVAVPPRWRSTPLAMPTAWDERSDVSGEQWAMRKAEKLRFISRRRAEPEAAEVLARRPLPTPHVPKSVAAFAQQGFIGWPAGAPPRPIHISQLYYSGVYDEIMAVVDEVAGGVAEAELNVRCGAPSVTMRKCDERVWRASECQPDWARGVVWDTSDPHDVVPMQSYSADDPVPHGISAEFFTGWGCKLSWTDTDMLQQVTVTGAEGRSTCEKDTVVMGHHGGLRANYKPARESVAKDVARGWISMGRRHLLTVPSRLVPKNVVPRQQWKLVMGELVSVTKWRVTTDDSIASKAGDIHSRNGAMDKSAWEGMSLPKPQTLAEAVAQIRAVAVAMGIVAAAAAFERIALWALDLSDAYREIEVNRSEWWQQGFIWYDGVRLDKRCVFGSAHMPGFFQRISSFVLAVASHRIKEYDAQHPYSAARQAWSQWRRAELGAEHGDCDFASIYLDDGSGATVLGPGEPLRGAPNVREQPVVAALTVDPGGRVRLELFGDKSRGQVHLQIMRSTFNEAGWRVAVEKVQYGLSLDLLGLGITSQGDGTLYVPEAKRLGMIEDISQALQPRQADGAVERDDFERLVGRSSNLGQVAAEANVYLQPLYVMQNAKSKYADRRSGRMVCFKPRRIITRGSGPTQIRCREALQWFKAALESGVSVPLAPRQHFPEVGDVGCAFLFTDAAREHGTGHGGFSVVHMEGADEAEMLFLEQRWPEDVLLALQQDELSMAAGETYGAVVMADAVLTHLRDATHMIVYTDSSVAEVAINTGNSPSPQINFLIRWLVERWPNVQFLGVWQKGIRNDVADRISRAGLAAVLDEAERAKLRLRQLAACDSAHDLMRAVWAEPQRVAKD